ncbi:hypothetical protein [Lacrimispora sp.]|uniref:hypothetical protein n=1 Tax=Lacrimispora sp. TaxID=2719234 RepID=UPI0028A7A613|nr:hypothetical protein [Lacrimispora sp.]
MFRKKLVILTMFISLGLLAGCKANDPNNYVLLSYKMSESGNVNSEVDDTASSTNPENNNNSDFLKSELLEETKDDLDVKIRYPQIENNENIMTGKISELIKEAAINKYYEQWNLKGLTLDQSYSVENRGSELLSIVFLGYVNVAGTAHPTDTCHAVTINLETAEKLALSDFIESYEFLENKIAGNEYEVLYGGFKSLTSDEILSIIRTNFGNITIDQNTQKFYISEDGKICIIIDLPNAGGDYSILCI